ncbi:MAG: UvrB/UvrC motif-containing protein [Candidatus Zixiibacteriota bacterium]
MPNKCSRCGSEKNVINIVKVIDGKTQKVMLCDSCMNKTLAEEQMGAMRISPEEILQAGREEYKAIHCSNCGMSWADVMELGYLGCEKCYEYMAEKLEDVLPLIQGTNRNRQKLLENRNDDEIRLSRLKLRLKEAVVREDFEVAARLRDKIAFYE